MATFVCPSCWHTQSVTDVNIARKARCPKCEMVARIIADSPPSTATFVCASCQYTQHGPDENIGRRARCPKCKGEGKIVGKPSSSDAVQVPPTQNTVSAQGNPTARQSTDALPVFPKIRDDRNPKARRKKQPSEESSITAFLVGFLAVAILFVTIFVIIFGLSCFKSSNSDSTPPKTPKQLRSERIEKQFHFWDGSHRGVTKAIKNSMNDPKSYEHVSTIPFDMGDHLIIKTVFRGRNVFGGVVKNLVRAKVDLKGNILDMSSQDY